MHNSGELSSLDRAIVAALQLNGRATWKAVAVAVDSTETTVARRAQRLLDSGIVRVVGVVDVLLCGLGTPALVGIRCRPGRTAEVGAAMAARDDVRFVTTVSGGTDVVAEFVVDGRAGLLDIGGPVLADPTLVDRVDHYPVLRTFRGIHDWDPGALPAEASAVLRPRKVPTFEATASTADQGGLDDLDHAIMGQLSQDGRRNYGEVASALDTSQATVSRRMDALLSTGRIRFRTLVQPSALGLPEEIMLWCKVSPAGLTAAATRLAEHPAVKYLVAASGEHQLIGRAALRDYESIYPFLTEDIAGIEDITDASITPEIQVLKRSWQLTLKGARQ
ncbi:Lrp/AsnC family transcriptional regulator [Aeromicrobium sp. YIM 150415]|uniref:Lrp/AsnC family transcriptional regulator n=1 Tax=Aeromicrobium piscarium TaxID=2590901 RepID=A0A554SH44_9ACTN|nr:MULTISPECIES: Lrp/AsnC family transcriptional regulator [Aeromicrobium]MBM9463029.1 Lrp/AsnC family transcriptional regulator [Aeromicrobium sp. YIM 150415]TSD65658.1 Lrp/AsnC family transcriptional regulator [Aeromicrobium piscarium]